MNRRLISLGWLAIAILLSAPTLTTAQIQVTSANPSAAPQGTTSLDVTVTGNGFRKGAKAQWFVTGTTNPGGVTVNSTTVNGPTQLTANITVATNATISGFDVLVTNTDGRTGKGTDKFAVTAQGTPIGCYTGGTPSGASLVTVLNTIQSNGTALITTLRLGDAIRVRPLDLDRNGTVDTLVAFVTSGHTSGSTPGTYVFLLDPVTGEQQAHNPITGAAWQNPILLLSGFGNTHAAAGDVNGDGIPDFAQAGGYSTPYVFVGSVDSTTYSPNWTAYPISAPSSTSVVFGDLDGLGVDEIVFGGDSSSKKSSPGGAFIYKYSNGTVSYIRGISDPAGVPGMGFGNAITIGNIDGTGNDLVVGAPSATTNGLVYVFPHPVQQSHYFTLTGPGPGFGRGLGTANVYYPTSGPSDLVVITGHQDDTTAQAFIYAGYVTPTSTYMNQLLPPVGLENGWGEPNIDVADMAAAGGIAVGAPNAIQGSSCNSIQGGPGALHLFTAPFGSSEYPNYVFETPSLVGSSQFEFGYSVGIVPGYPFIIIGEHFRDVGATAQAGQVYVYKMN